MVRTNHLDAMSALPLCCGGYDPAYHTTVADLVDLVAWELTLHDEGEESDITTKADLAQCRLFIRKYARPH